MRVFDRVQFYEALTLLSEAKLRGLQNLGLIKIQLEADALTSGVYPSIVFTTDGGRRYEYTGDDFSIGLEALRKMISKARREASGK